MSDNIYLKRLFKAYYEEKRDEIPLVNGFDEREFGFIPWDAHKIFMKRHIGLRRPEDVKSFFIDHAPRHAYSSGTLYEYPDNLEMKNKGYKGCDFIIDIDVDHFYTPCKDDHDFWICKECGKTGKGMPEKCPKCKTKRITILAWICEECLEVSKEEILKLINDFLIPDFRVGIDEMKIAFSGHRGYHLKIENEKMRALSGDSRREMVDYLTGHNLSLEVLGLRTYRTNILGLSKENIGWSRKIIEKMETLLTTYSNVKLENVLINFGLSRNRVTSFMNSKDGLLKTIQDKNRNSWNIEGFGLTTWKQFLKGIIELVGAEIDEPVTIDIHRLIRYPGSLHGKTGFKVQELTLEQLENFNPLDEPDETLDPIVFFSKHMQSLEITALNVPQTKLKGERYGPYKKGDIIEVPNHVAIFLLCKGVAKTK